MTGFLSRAIVLGTVSFVSLLIAGETSDTSSSEDLYKDYAPDFINGKSHNLMQLSLQSTFYNRASVLTDERANALLREGIKKEQAGEFREAIKLYQRIIEKFPDALTQLSPYGVFGSSALIVQRRILAFPPKELEYYRLLCDPAAKELYQRASASFSEEGLHEAARFHLATSYGAKAVYDIGCREMDLGHFEEAAKCLGDLKKYFPASDLKTLNVDARLSELRTRELAQTGFSQIKNPSYISFSDYTHFAPLSSTLSSQSVQWKTDLPLAPDWSSDDMASKGELLPFHEPWVVGNSLYYKHYNQIYCQSPIDGHIRWTFDLGPLARDARRLLYYRYGHRQSTLWYSDQDILVDEGMVLACIQAYGRRDSLVALDRVTGEVRWMAGPIQPRDETDFNTRYDAIPSLGRNAIYAPWTCDEGEGASIVSVTAGITAFEKDSGWILWRKNLCQLSPTVNTQEQRGIRIFSAPPLIHEGTIFHCTNAGVVTSLDAVTGEVHWMTRYPHVWNSHLLSNYGNNLDAHDDVPFGSAGTSSFAQTSGPRFCNQMPIVLDNKLFVAPVDSDNLLCIDKTSGKVLWNLQPPRKEGANAPSMLTVVGITHSNELVIAGGELSFYDCETGKYLWNFTPSYRSNFDFYLHAPGELKAMTILGRPTLTQDDKIYFTSIAVPDDAHHTSRTNEANAVYGEWCISAKERKLIDHRIAFSPYYTRTVEGVMRGRMKDEKNGEELQLLTPPQDINNPGSYDPVRRLPYLLYGVPVEIITSGQSLSASCDLQALAAAAQKNNVSHALFTQAEIFLQKGQEVQAITAFEKCRQLAGPEEQDFIREIGRELFRLYRSQAWKALVNGDAALFHQRCAQMSSTATTASEELVSTFALSESFENQGNFARSVLCLQNAIRHYSGTIHTVPGTMLGDRESSVAALNDTFRTFAANRPAGRVEEFGLLEKSVERQLPPYFSAVAPLEPQAELDAETFAIAKLELLLARHPEFKAQFETLAQQALSAGTVDVRLAEMRAFPGTSAAQKVLDEVRAEVAKLSGAERQRRIWQLCDLAARFRLDLPKEFEAEAGLKLHSDEGLVSTGKLEERMYEFTDAFLTLRRLLKDRSESAGNLLFVGGRSKKRLDNKFSLECWDLKQWKQKWRTPDLRLKGKGDESGFEEIFTIRDRVITHGKFDILAFGLEKGETLWSYRLPFDFDLRTMDCVGDLLIVSGAQHTLALQGSTGEVVWSVEERGELYDRPIIRDDTLVSVRREPFGVTFRRLAGGGLIRTLKMQNLSVVTKHPVLASDINQAVADAGATSSRLPIACAGELLMLTDGAYYIAVDLKTRSIRWKREIDSNDISDAPMRFYINGGNVVVLKRDFTVPALYLLDANTGAVKGAPRKSKDVVFSIVFDPAGDHFYGIAPPETGRRTVVLKGFETATFKETFRKEVDVFETTPDAEIIGLDSGRLVLRALQPEDIDAFIVDTRDGTIKHHTNLKAAGEYAAHGGREVLTQGPHLFLISASRMSATINIEK